MKIRRKVGGTAEMASCAEVMRSLEAYLDGEIRDELTARRLASHLEVCESCGLEAHTLTELKTRLTRLESVDVTTVEELKQFARSLAK